MIRKNLLFIKMQNVKTSSKILFDRFMTRFVPEKETCPICGSRGECHIHAYYGRTITDFVNGRRAKCSICVMRVICESCHHTHAILPDHIIPYGTYLSHNGVPFETCGNKEVPVIRQWFGENSSNAGFDVTEANLLCEKGIATLAFWGGAWRLWGDSTAAYEYGGEYDIREVFDVSLRMLLYLTNRFQKVWADTIGKPFTLAQKDTIMIREQQNLDALVALGALIGSPTIKFDGDVNPLSEVREGNFRFDLQATPTPPLRSASAYVAYTDAGFSAYFE